MSDTATVTPNEQKLTSVLNGYITENSNLSLEAKLLAYDLDQAKARITELEAQISSSAPAEGEVTA